MENCITDSISQHNHLASQQVQHKENELEMHEERIPLLQSQVAWSQLCSRQCERSCLKSKAAVVVLFWSMFVIMTFQIFLQPGILYVLTEILFQYLADGNAKFLRTTSFLTLIYGLTALFFLFYPLAGFIADVCFGRFKILQCSLWSLWVISLLALLFCGISVGLTHLNQTLGHVTLGTACVIGGIVLLAGYIFFSANIIQFGLDQLQDRPASDSSLFIYWYVWIQHFCFSFFSFSIKFFGGYCSLVTKVPGITLMTILGAVVFLGYMSLPITLCLVHRPRIQRWFMIEPGAQNPYKLVYKVLKFAAKHDRPIQRSAFTYCEDEQPSRLDLGKSKYGGPFTTEEVENVKCFVGIFFVLLSLGPIFVVEVAAKNFLSDFYMHIEGYNRSSSLAMCTLFTAFSTSRSLSSAIIVILIPLYVYLLRPYLRSCRTFGTLKRLGVAMLLFTMSLLVTFTVDTVGHNHPQDTNATCMFINSFSNETRVPLSSVNSNVVLLPTILNAFAVVLFYTGAYEFICAQSPHSMKGLIIGTLFAIEGISMLIGIMLPIPFKTLMNAQKHFPSCGFAYYLFNIIIGMISFVIHIVVARSYHYRERDEPSNVQQYAEKYYENIQDEQAYHRNGLNEQFSAISSELESTM